MDLPEIVNRVLGDLEARPSGPLAFRFVLQPTVALMLAIRDGIKDAKEGRTAYLWTIASDPTQRASWLREGLRATSKVVVLALILDGIYQALVLRRIYPGEALVVALLLGFVPYALFRGPISRLVRRNMRHRGRMS